MKLLRAPLRGSLKCNSNMASDIWYPSLTFLFLVCSVINNSDESTDKRLMTKIWSQWKLRFCNDSNEMQRKIVRNAWIKLSYSFANNQLRTYVSFGREKLRGFRMRSELFCFSFLFFCCLITFCLKPSWKKTKKTVSVEI